MSKSLQSLRSAHTTGLVSVTSPCDWPPEEFTLEDYSQGLVPRTVHTKRFEEQVAGNSPKNSNWFEFVGLIAGIKVGPCDLILKQKWPVPIIGLVQRLVAGTSRGTTESLRVYSPLHLVSNTLR